jgi:hypothetical protein
MLALSLLLATIATVLLQAADASDLTTLGALLLAALPGISGALATLAYSGVKTILPPYDRLPAIVHQIAAPLFGFLFGYFLVTKLGLRPVDTLAGLDLEWWNASFTSLGMAGIFRYFKRSTPTDATIALEATRKSTSLSSKV